VLPATSVWPLADALDLESGAAFGLTFLTAWQMLSTRRASHRECGCWSTPRRRESRWPRYRSRGLYGARVVATAGTPEKRALALSLGAEEAFDSKDLGWVKKTREWAGPRGIQVVADHVGQETFPGSLQTLAKGGRYVFVGASSGFEMKADFRPSSSRTSRSSARRWAAAPTW